MASVSDLLWQEIRRQWTARRGLWGALLVLGLLAILAVFWVTQGVALNRFFNAVDRQLAEWSSLQLGRAGALAVAGLLAWIAIWIAVVFMALVLGALWQNRTGNRLKLVREERDLLQRELPALRKERDDLKAERHGWRQVNRYGRAWIQIPPLADEIDRRILTNVGKEMSQKLEQAMRWAGKVWGDLQGKTYNPVENTPAAMLGGRINALEFDHLKNALSAVNHFLHPGRDPRAALVSAYIAYHEWRRQVLWFALTFDVPIQKLTDYRKWFDAEGAFEKFMWERANNTLQIGDVVSAAAFYLQENRPDPLPSPEV